MGNQWSALNRYCDSGILSIANNRCGKRDKAVRDRLQELAVRGEQAGWPAGGGADEPGADMQAKRSGTVGVSA